MKATYTSADRLRGLHELNKIRREFVKDIMHVVQVDHRGCMPGGRDAFIESMAKKYTTIMTCIRSLDDGLFDPKGWMWPRDFALIDTSGLCQKYFMQTRWPNMLCGVRINERNEILELITPHFPEIQTRGNNTELQLLHLKTDDIYTKKSEGERWVSNNMNKRVWREVNYVHQCKEPHRDADVIFKGGALQRYNLVVGRVQGLEHMHSLNTIHYNHDQMDHLEYQNFPGGIPFPTPTRVVHLHTTHNGEMILFHNPEYEKLPDEQKRFEYLMGAYESLYGDMPK